MTTPKKSPPSSLPAVNHNQFSRAVYLSDAGLIFWLWWAFGQFTGHLLVGSVWLAIIALVWSGVIWFSIGHGLPGEKIRGRWIWRLFLTLTASFLFSFFLVREATPLSGKLLWLTLATTLLTLGLRIAWWASCARLPKANGELWRWLLLGALATALLYPYYQDGGLGAGDAHWYTMMVADFVTQLRAGIFPIWTGQSEFAFNGAVFPLRIAPLLQHEAGALDLLTGCSLSPLALKNAVLALNGFAIVFSAYAAFRGMLPQRPNVATVLAGFFLTSPAILAPLYAGDQFMTFAALPFLPAVFYGGWRLWARDDFPARAWLTMGLAGLWSAHSPIGMWTTFCAGALWAARIVTRSNRRSAWRDTAVMAAMFGPLASWPLISTLSLDNLNTGQTSRVSVIENIRDSFPANLQPVSTAANKLTDYQPGFAAIALFALALLIWATRKSTGSIPLALLAFALPTLMMPVPGWTEWFWFHVPQALVNVTNSWPMQRLMAIWVATLLFFAAGVFASSTAEKSEGKIKLLTTILLTLLLSAWSGYEAFKFPRSAAHSRTSSSAAELTFAPQNRLITRYSYLSFAHAPRYFSHGYMDPLWENRLLRLSDGTLIASNAEGATRTAPLQQGVITATNDNHSHYYRLTPVLSLEPGQRYALTLEFQSSREPAVLQLRGDNIFHEYVLPDSGDGMSPAHLSGAFGSLPNSSHSISLRNDSTQAEKLSGTYIAHGRPIEPAFPLARYSLHVYRPADLPVSVKSLMPYRASAYVPEPATLETPRMWLGRYRATVNGHPAEVSRSANNLAMVRLDLGDNEVALDYDPGIGLRTSYWLTLASWTLLVALLLRKIISCALFPGYFPDEARASGAS